MRTMINEMDLEMVTGGARVYGTKNYLALRNRAVYSTKTEIGRLYNGEQVTVLKKGIRNGNYKYTLVYSPKLHRCGYVVAGYLR